MCVKWLWDVSAVFAILQTADFCGGVCILSAVPGSASPRSRSARSVNGLAAKVVFRVAFYDVRNGVLGLVRHARLWRSGRWRSRRRRSGHPCCEAAPTSSALSRCRTSVLVCARLALSPPVAVYFCLHAECILVFCTGVDPHGSTVRYRRAQFRLVSGTPFTHAFTEADTSKFKCAGRPRLAQCRLCGKVVRPSASGSRSAPFSSSPSSAWCSRCAGLGSSTKSNFPARRLHSCSTCSTAARGLRECR